MTSVIIFKNISLKCFICLKKEVGNKASILEIHIKGEAKKDKKSISDS